MKKSLRDGEREKRMTLYIQVRSQRISDDRGAAGLAGGRKESGRRCAVKLYGRGYFLDGAPAGGLGRSVRP